MVKCGECLKGLKLDEQGPGGESIIECRCNPPQPLAMMGPPGMDGRPTMSINFFFPRMAADSWCGQGEAKVSILK